MEEDFQNIEVSKTTTVQISSTSSSSSSTAFSKNEKKEGIFFN